MSLNLPDLRQHLNDFDFRSVFNDLGWSRPASRQGKPVAADGIAYILTEIAQLGPAVLEVSSPDGTVPDAKARDAVGREVGKLYRENLLIFVDAARSQSAWYWIKRDQDTDGKVKVLPRTHLFLKGQPDDLIVSKLAPMFVDLSELDADGNVPVVAVARELREALDTEAVTKRFYTDFSKERLAFIEHIKGIDDERDRAWYASVLLNRLMFVYFLQRKGFLNDDRENRRYLQVKFDESRARGEDRFYSEFLQALFFEGFARPEKDAAVVALIGNIKYLNGGLFLPHQVEERWAGRIEVADQTFASLLTLFERYDWNLDDRPEGNPREISPHVLGYIFEKYINQKAFGAYYTRPEITEYLCEQTIHRLVLDRVNDGRDSGPRPKRKFETVGDLMLGLDAPLCKQLLDEVLPSLSLLDPACGSGAFLVAAMKTLMDIYGAVLGRIEVLGDPTLAAWLRGVRVKHRSVHYFIKKKIITDNLYGVDLMEEAGEIARLRLFLALVSSAETVDDLEPLPNIDFNILAGNSLIGLLHVDEAEYERLNPQQDLYTKPYPQLVAEKNAMLRSYRNAAELGIEDLRGLRENIESHRRDALKTLNRMLLAEFGRLGIRVEQATWDAAKGAEGKASKRPVAVQDIEALHPFHWGYEFSEVMERGGFDAIIANPPWDIVKPQAKEFLAEHSELVTKNKMTIKAFEDEQARVLQDPVIRSAWLEYLSRIPHQSAYFRAAPQFKSQSSTVNGKRTGSDLNLYKLFLEQGFNLLKSGGQCGIVIPSGIYTDLGAKGLRELLFEQTQITGLFGFENRKEVFEGVHRSFKFVVLTFEKGGTTENFPAAFMRHDVAELDVFPRQGALNMSVDLVRRSSPDSMSIAEFQDAKDVQITEKLLSMPLLGEKIEGVWNLSLAREFDMTNDAALFQTLPAPGSLPLF